MGQVAIKSAYLLGAEHVIGIDEVPARLQLAQEQSGAEVINFLTEDFFERLKEMTGFEGGELEKRYRGLQSDYDDAASRVAAVHKRVQDVETVRTDLFAEWEKEIQQMSSAELQKADRDKLRDTRARYEELHASLKRAEQSMDPVLTRLHDQVLYLKHNLNAAAIASLKG